jgi:hypothetical protein
VKGSPKPQAEPSTQEFLAGIVERVTYHKKAVFAFFVSKLVATAILSP